MPVELGVKIGAKDVGVHRVFGAMRRELLTLGTTAVAVGRTASRAFSGMVGSIFSLRGAILGLGVGALGASFVSAASKMENFRITLEVLLKSEEKAAAALQSLRDFARQTPLDTADVIESFTLLTSVGIANAEKVVEVLGGVSLLFQREVTDITMALVRMETETLGALGVLVDRSGAKTVITLGNLRVEVEKNRKAEQAAMIELWAKAYPDAIDRASKTWSAFVKIAASEWFEFRDDVMAEGGFDALKGIFESLLDSVTELRESGRLKEIVAEWGASIAGLARDVQMFVRDKGLEQWGLRAQIVFGSAKIALEGLAGIAATTFATIMDLIGGYGKLMGTTGETYREINALQEEWDKLNESFMETRDPQTADELLRLGKRLGDLKNQLREGEDWWDSYGKTARENFRLMDEDAARTWGNIGRWNAELQRLQEQARQAHLGQDVMIPTAKGEVKIRIEYGEDPEHAILRQLGGPVQSMAKQLMETQKIAAQEAVRRAWAIREAMNQQAILFDAAAMAAL